MIVYVKERDLMNLKQENALPLFCKRCRTRYPAGNKYCICGGLLYTKEGLAFERTCEILLGIGFAGPRKEKR